MFRTHSILSGQKGASLVIALIMTLLVLMLGVSATAISLQGERASRNLRDRQITLEAAELALMDARNEILGSGARTALFDGTSTIHFHATCHPGDARAVGLCDFSTTGSSHPWLLVPFDTEHNPQYVSYGQFTGALMPAGEGLLPSHPPRYIIDVVPLKEMGRCADCPIERKVLYRVTAVGFGPRPETQVMLQTMIAKDV